MQPLVPEAVCYLFFFLVYFFFWVLFLFFFIFFLPQGLRACLHDPNGVKNYLVGRPGMCCESPLLKRERAGTIL